MDFTKYVEKQFKPKWTLQYMLKKMWFHMRYNEIIQ